MTEDNAPHFLHEPPAGYSLPCGTGCAACKPMPMDPWSDFVICTHPYAPQRGMPVRLGRECPWYTTATKGHRK